MKKILILLGFTLSISVLADPSFDCSSKKLTKIEKIICSDKILSDLDFRMADIYKNLEQNYSEVRTLQVIWLNKRNRLSGKRNKMLKTLKASYESQIKTLETFGNLSRSEVEKYQGKYTYKDEIVSAELKFLEKNGQLFVEATSVRINNGNLASIEGPVYRVNGKLANIYSNCIHIFKIENNRLQITNFEDSFCSFGVGAYIPREMTLLK